MRFRYRDAYERLQTEAGVNLKTWSVADNMDLEHIFQVSNLIEWSMIEFMLVGIRGLLLFQVWQGSPVNPTRYAWRWYFFPRSISSWVSNDRAQRAKVDQKAANAAERGKADQLETKTTGYQTHSRKTGLRTFTPGLSQTWVYLKVLRLELTIVDQPKSDSDVLVKPKIPDIQVFGSRTSKSTSDIAHPPLGPNVLLFLFSLFRCQ